MQTPSVPTRTRATAVRRISPFAFLLVTLAALLALPAVNALAAPPPFLTAKENPVLIPLGQTTGNYTLSWFTGNEPSAELYLSNNSGADIGPTVVSGYGTSALQPIKLGEVHQWTMYTKGKKDVIGSVTVTTKRPDQSCKEQCITRVQPTPHGSWVHFEIATAKIVKQLKVEVHEKGKASADEKVTHPASTVWQPDLSHLKPDTDYFFTVWATDEANNSQFKIGTFHTKKRKVQLNFESIHVTDDSDDLSAGDLTFWFATNGTWDMANTYGEVSIDTGDTAHPNHAATVNNAPATLSVGTYGWDDDCDFGEFCSSGIGPGNGGGSNDDADWATANGSVNVAKDGPGEDFSSSFDIATTAHALKFSVHITFTVSYV